MAGSPGHFFNGEEVIWANRSGVLHNGDESTLNGKCDWEKSLGKVLRNS